MRLAIVVLLVGEALLAYGLWLAWAPRRVRRPRGLSWSTARLA